MERSVENGFGWERNRGEVVFDLGHELLPGPRGFTAVALGLAVVVVAEPNGCGQLRNRADEPEVPRPFRCARLSGDGAILKLGGNPGATGHHPLHHPVHGVGHVTVEGAAAPITIHTPTPEQFILRSADLLEGRWFDEHSAVGHRCVGRGHVQDGLLVGADRHRVVLAKRALGADVEAVGCFDDGVESHLVLQLHRHGVQGVLQRIGKGDPTEVFGSEIFRAIPPPASGLIDEDVLRLDAAIDGCGVREQLEGGAR